MASKYPLPVLKHVINNKLTNTQRKIWLWYAQRMPNHGAKTFVRFCSDNMINRSYAYQIARNLWYVGLLSDEDILSKSPSIPESWRLIDPKTREGSGIRKLQKIIDKTMKDFDRGKLR